MDRPTHRRQTKTQETDQHTGDRPTHRGQINTQKTDKHTGDRPSHRRQTVAQETDHHTGDRPTHRRQTITQETDQHTEDRPTHRRQTNTQEADHHTGDRPTHTRQMWTFWAPCACAARIAMRPTGPQPMTAAEVASSGYSLAILSTSPRDAQNQPASPSTHDTVQTGFIGAVCWSTVVVVVPESVHQQSFQRGLMLYSQWMRPQVVRPLHTSKLQAVCTAGPTGLHAAVMLHQHCNRLQ